MKYTKDKLKKLITEEKKTSKEYRQHGFPQLARQESRHARVFEKKLKGMR
jgi:rubrerythrin